MPGTPTPPATAGTPGTQTQITGKRCRCRFVSNPGEYKVTQPVTAPPVSKALGTLVLWNSGWHKPHQTFGTVRLRAHAPQRPASSSGKASRTINTQCPLFMSGWHPPCRPPGEKSRWPIPCVAAGLCWHSPVFTLTAVRDSGFSTTRQPGVAAVPSCWMSHCSHCTSSAAGLSQSTLPFLPDTAAMKAQGDGSPGDKRDERELPLHAPLLPCTTQKLGLTQLLSTPSFLS